MAPLPPTRRYSARCNLACYDAFATKDAWEFFQWGWDDDRVVGIAPYHWNTCPHCKRSHNEIGTKDLRLAKAAWRQIGERIGRAWAAGGGGCRRPYCSGEEGFGEIAALIPQQHGAGAPRPPGAFGHFGHVHRKKRPRVVTERARVPGRTDVSFTRVERGGGRARG